MLGNIEEQQKLIEQKLQELILEETSADQELIVKMNGAFQIEDIKINLSKIDLTSSEHLEYIILSTFNNLLKKIQNEQAIQSQKLISNMIPGGLDRLQDMFDRLKQ